MRDTAKRSKMSLSKAYAIVNGDDNVEFETFENIATAFSMSPAELAVAIGKGTASDDPKRVPIHAALREVPDEQLATVELMIRGLAIQPTQRAKGRTDRAAKSLRQRRAEVLTGVDTSEPQERKSRQFAIPKLSTHHDHALKSLLAALGLNRDSQPVALGA